MIEDYIEYDGKKYTAVESIDINNNVYIYLVNVDDQKDFFIRKLNESSSSLDPVESEDEFNLALDAFYKKHKEFLEDI